MNTDERAALAATLLEASRAMLASGERQWELVGERLLLEPLRGTVAASIGLSGPESLKGKLVLIAQPEFYRSMHPMGPAAGAALSDDDLADWASEMANQLLGRIKNLLSARELDFTLSIPTVVRGDRMELLCRDRPGCIERCVRVDGHLLDLLLEMERPDGGALLGRSLPVESQPEGLGPAILIEESRCTRSWWSMTL